MNYNNQKTQAASVYATHKRYGEWKVSTFKNKPDSLKLENVRTGKMRILPTSVFTNPGQTKAIYDALPNKMQQFTDIYRNKVITDHKLLGKPVPNPINSNIKGSLLATGKNISYGDTSQRKLLPGKVTQHAVNKPKVPPKPMRRGIGSIGKSYRRPGFFGKLGSTLRGGLIAGALFGLVGPSSASKEDTPDQRYEKWLYDAKNDRTVYTEENIWKKPHIQLWKEFQEQYLLSESPLQRSQLYNDYRKQLEISEYYLPEYKDKEKKEWLDQFQVNIKRELQQYDQYFDELRQQEHDALFHKGKYGTS